MSHILSKTTYLYGCQCPKRLALHKFNPELRNPPDPGQEAVFARGTDVGLLARQLFPGGVDASPPDSFKYHLSVAKTQKLIEKGTPIIYEAAFLYEGLLCAVDILVKEGDRWNAYEVKSTNSVKDQHIADAGYQYAVIVSSGLPVGEFYITHFNREYVRRGEINLQELFSFSPVTEAVREQYDDVIRKAGELKEMVRFRQVPQAAIGPHCFDPYDCDFINHCWQHVPEDSVFDLAGNLRGLEWTLYNRGVVRLLDIPSDQRLPAGAEIQLRHYLSGEPLIDKTAINNFLGQLKYPLCFLDFETINYAVPPFDGMHTYQQMPYQYSLHIVPGPGQDAIHREFLADNNDDPRGALIENLLKDLKDGGTILAYNASFEARELENLASDFSQYAPAIEALLPRIVDLMIPFRSKAYYHPEFKGSYSIKQVLPVLVPSLSYKTLEVRDGTMAGITWQEFLQESDPIHRTSLRKSLLDYCKMDTWAMVKILEKLEELAA